MFRVRARLPSRGEAQQACRLTARRRERSPITGQDRWPSFRARRTGNGSYLMKRRVRMTATEPPASKSEFEQDEEPKPGIGVIAWSPARSREWTRAALAIGLAALLAAVVLLILWATLFRDYPPTDARDLLGLVVAPLAGLVGAATGFYYGGQHK